MADEKPKTISLREGEYLSPSEGAEVTLASPTSVIAVAGMARSGKTTLIAGLYELFHRGPFAGHLFAWCRTLPGFERRCHLARLCSGRGEPDTERTLHSDFHELLHLRLLDASSLGQRDLLFSDIYGEDFRLAADFADECRKIQVFSRADHVAVLVDGNKAVRKAERQSAFTAADSLLRQCLDSGMLGKTSNVQIVVTKWDRAAGRGDAFIDEKLHWLSARHGVRLAELTAHRVALRSKGEIKSGFGMEELLKQWLVVPRRFAALPPIEAVPYCSEFDRLELTWPVTLGLEGHE